MPPNNINDLRANGVKSGERGGGGGIPLHGGVLQPGLQIFHAIVLALHAAGVPVYQRRWNLSYANLSATSHQKNMDLE